MRKEIPIMFCFDNNYVIPASVAFYSLLENCNRNKFYKFFVLHSDITKDNQTKLEETIEEFSSFSSLEFIDMTNKFDDLWERIKTKGHFSKEVMYKVLVASIFPQYEKIIVSDVDVVFLNDISESYDSLDVNDDAYLAGVKAVGKIMHYMDNYKPIFSDEEIVKLSGFCGGYIVFNLKKLRDDDMESKFIECFEKEGHRINQMEQDVLNLCCFPKTKPLHLKYVACSYMWDLYKTEEDFNNDINYSKKELIEAMDETVQLHYATSVKPWKNVDCTKSEEWFKYITKTPFLTEYLRKLPKSIILPKEEIVDKNHNNSSRIKSLFNRSIWYAKNNPLFFIKLSFYKKLTKKVINKFTRKDNQKISLLIVDDVFPNASSPFRYEEFLTYLYRIKKSKFLANQKMLDDNAGRIELGKSLTNFNKENPKLKNRVEYSGETKAKLATLVFLNNAYENIEFIEKNAIPFIFTLYPGGGFSINNIESDEKLKKVLASPFFRKVIVTQKITYDYLVEKEFCPSNKIEFIYGGILTRKLYNNDLVPKVIYGRNKKTFDICFVAHKYIEKGKDKGYDIFIEIAKLLAKKHSNFRFHVVGEFSESDIDVKELKNRIKFYGTHETSWFPTFYIDKDIIISPNRPFILSPGSFDGFPTSCCLEAMLNKVALFCTDKLNLNANFIDGQDLIIIDDDVQKTAKRIEYYYKNIDELLKLADNGYLAVKRNYSYKKQLAPRIKLIRNLIKYNKKVDK